MSEKLLLENIYLNWMMGLITMKEYYCQRADVIGMWYRMIYGYIPEWAYNLYERVKYRHASVLDAVKDIIMTLAVVVLVIAATVSFGFVMYILIG